MSLRGAQRRSNLIELVNANGDGEIATASFGWLRNDILGVGKDSHDEGMAFNNDRLTLSIDSLDNVNLP